MLLRFSIRLMILLIIPFSGIARTDANLESAIDFVEMTATPASNIVHFKWLVNREIGGKSFLIEKSLDEETWTAVDEVPSLANHAQQHTYMISEINMTEGVEEHFRIVRVDHNGLKEVMAETAVSHPALSNLFLIPKSKSAKGEIIVSCTALNASRGELQILDMSGNMRFEEHVTLRPGYNRVTINSRSLPESTYVIVLKDGDGHQLTHSFTNYTGTKRKSKF